MATTTTLRAWRTIALAVLMVLAAQVALRPQPAGAEVVGNTYSGPIHGFTVTWSDAWFVLAEDVVPGSDSLFLGNGQSVVSFAGIGELSGNAQVCAATYWSVLSGMGETSNVQPLVDANGAEVNGADDARAYTAVTFTKEEGGATQDYVLYHECRVLVPGVSLLMIDQLTPLWAYESEAPLVQELLTGVTLPSPGEAGPAFMTGAWRVAVAAVALNDAMPEVSLEAKAGKAWLLVIADVTNTAAEPRTLRPADFGALTEGASKPASLAKSSTPSVARRLDLQPADIESVEIAAGQTTRLGLVFQIKAAAAAPALTHKGAVLPLERTLRDPIDLSDLPPVSGPPRLVEATVDEVIDGGTLSVVLPGENDPRTVRLIGIDAPTGDECYADKATSKLRGLAGATVLLEMDQDDGARYAWLRKDDGSLSMLNRQLIVGGYAGYGVETENRRFADWLQQGETVAQEKPAGLWKSCTGLHGTSLQPGASRQEEGSVASVAAVLVAPDGQWTGTTAEGGEFSVIVLDGGISEYHYTESCNGTMVSGAHVAAAPIQVTNLEFTLETATSLGTDAMTGRFRPDSTAAGTLVVTFPDQYCSGRPIETTWEARLAG